MIDQLFNLRLDQAITDMSEPDTEIDTTTAVVMLTVSSPTNEPESESKGIQDEDKGEVLISELPKNEDDDKECSKETSQDDERLITDVAEENITKAISGGESTATDDVEDSGGKTPTAGDDVIADIETSESKQENIAELDEDSQNASVTAQGKDNDVMDSSKGNKCEHLCEEEIKAEQKEEPVDENDTTKGTPLALESLDENQSGSNDGINSGDANGDLGKSCGSIEKIMEKVEGTENDVENQTMTEKNAPIVQEQTDTCCKEISDVELTTNSGILKQLNIEDLGIGNITSNRRL